MTPNPDRQPSATGLAPTTGLSHGPVCGERIPSPHEICQRRVAPYLGAERQSRRYGVIVRCNVCGMTWREVRR